MTRLLVVGSINMDDVFEVPRLPRSGETLCGHSLRRTPGGKGADQAVAAARLGAQVHLLGCVGADADGRALLQHLRAEHVGTDHVRTVADMPTGRAVVFACQGESAIVVAPGASHSLVPADVHAAEPLFAHCDLVLAELGIPMATALAAAALARRHGKPLLLTLSPACAVSADLARQVTLFLVNQHELAAGFQDGHSDWRGLLAQWPGRIVVTRGSAGAAHVDAQGVLHEQPAFRVPVLDTTGAGDAFAAALAVHWTLGIPRALAPACAAAALAVQGFGSQATLPTRRQLDDFLASAQAY